MLRDDALRTARAGSHESLLLDERQVRDGLTRQNRIWLPALLLACLALVAYLALVGLIRVPLVNYATAHFGKSAGEFAIALAILPAFGAILIPCAGAEWLAKRNVIACPHCRQAITLKIRRILESRCCPECSRQVLPGRAHSAAVLRRRHQIRTRAFLRIWLWAWPAMSVVAIAWEAASRNAFARCSHMLWVVPLVGFSVAGWSWKRTRDVRYAAPAALSLALFCAGAWLYWR